MTCCAAATGTVPEPVSDCGSGVSFAAPVAVEQPVFLAWWHESADWRFHAATGQCGHWRHQHLTVNPKSSGLLSMAQ